MACLRRQESGICVHDQCPFPTETKKGEECVELNFASGLCEVGENCLEKCPHSFTQEGLRPCPECNGRRNEFAVCGTCGDWGKVRK